MNLLVSVIIPTHAAPPERLHRVLERLQTQTLPVSTWELIVIDSASPVPLHLEEVQQGNPATQLIRLEQPGLTAARLAGINAASGGLVVFVDDDNLLAADYLEQAVAFMKQHPEVGVCGGIISAEFEKAPAKWVAEFYGNLALRNFGSRTLISQPHVNSLAPIEYPSFAPVGAGMVLRASCAHLFELRSNEIGLSVPDRTGKQLSSGGDCAINCVAILADYRLAYTPALSLTHCIPAHRVTTRHLGNLLYEISKSWVLVLQKYNSSPWSPQHPALALLRKLRALYRTRGFLGRANWVRWREACGSVDGRAAIFPTVTFSESLHALGQELRLGQLWYQCYHRPLRIFRHIGSRGLQLSFAMARGKYKMRSAAHRLTVHCSSEPTELTVHMLTGERYWYQSLFCLYSLGTQAGVPFSARLYDDGSLSHEQKNILMRALPRTTIVSPNSIEELLDQKLPYRNFPILRELRQSYPHIKKLTDIHSQSDGWKLVLDSDMLFFRRPNILLDWARDPQSPIFLQDTENSYGYPLDSMQAIAGYPIPERVNVGIFGYHSGDIDWHSLESWCHQLTAEHGMHYCLEQALSAMLAARFANKLCLPASEYIVAPQSVGTTDSRPVLHHYVSESKTLYFTSSWQEIADSLTAQ